MKIKSKSALFLVLLGSLTSASVTPSIAATNDWATKPSWTTPNNPGNSKQSLKKSIEPQVSPFSPGSNNIGIDLGQVFLMGDLSDSYTDNIGFQVSYTYGVSDIFGFESNFGYSSHSDGEFSMSSLRFGLRTNLAWFDRIIPYTTFGLGFYRPSYTFDASTPNTDSTSISPLLFGIHLGPGVNLQITDQIFFGTSLTFHDIFGTDKVNPITKRTFTAGGTFISLFINAGIAF